MRKGMIDFISGAACMLVMIFALWYGMGREIERMDKIAIYNCAQYGHAMNNYERQHNRPAVCQ